MLIILNLIKQSLGINCKETFVVKDVTIKKEIEKRINEGKEKEIGCFDTSTVTNMQLLFSDKDSFNGDLSSWDVSMVVRMNVSYINAVIYFVRIDLSFIYITCLT